MKKLTKIFAGTAIAATLIIGTAAFAACGNNGTTAGGGSDKLTADTPQEVRNSMQSRRTERPGLCSRCLFIIISPIPVSHAAPVPVSAPIW